MDRAHTMGPREKQLREQGHARCDFGCGRLERAVLADALEEALAGWDDAAQYKGEFLRGKHGDADDIKRLRSVLEEADHG